MPMPPADITATFEAPRKALTVSLAAGSPVPGRGFDAVQIQPAVTVGFRGLTSLGVFNVLILSYGGRREAGRSGADLFVNALRGSAALLVFVRLTANEFAQVSLKTGNPPAQIVVFDLQKLVGFDEPLAQAERAALFHQLRPIQTQQR